MAGNNVTLTMAGDSAKLESAFDRVGAASARMESSTRQAGDGFDRVGEQADNLDTRAMGFRDTLTGVQDGMDGFKKASQGDFGIETWLLLGFAVGDLASGMFNLLIPAMKSAVTWLKTTKVAALAQAVASKVAAAGQWLLNIAMSANPVALIIIAVIALIAIIVLIATKTTWFQTLWKKVWSGIVAYIKWVANNYKMAFTAIAAAGVWLWNKIKAIGSGIKSVFVRIASAISAPFRAAFNAVARLWNSTIGRLSWSVPGWVPIIGGNTISAPKLPTLHTGGRVPGTPGQSVVAMLQAGETVTAAGATGGTTAVIEIRSGGSRLDDLLTEVLMRAVRTRPDLRAAIGTARA
jgi:hypothetical protein